MNTKAVLISTLVLLAFVPACDWLKRAKKEEVKTVETAAGSTVATASTASTAQP